MRIFNSVGDMLREFGRIAKHEAKQRFVRLAEYVIVKCDGVPPSFREPQHQPPPYDEEPPSRTLWN